MRLFTLLAICAAPAAADVSLSFIEGAPKDRFVLTNATCGLSDATLRINLSTAPAGVIFDVTASGAGVEVFQPVEVVSGNATTSAVTDGDQVLTATLGPLAQGEQVIISADLDDLQTDGALGQIRVAGSEIAGVSATITLPNGTHIATFGTDATATFATLSDACQST